MQRVVSFYEKLPRGAAPAPQPKGLLGRYQQRYFSGKNPSAMRTSTHRTPESVRAELPVGMEQEEEVPALSVVGHGRGERIGMQCKEIRIKGSTH